MRPKNSSSDSAPRLNAPPLFSVAAGAGAGAAFLGATGAFFAAGAMGAAAFGSETAFLVAFPVFGSHNFQGRTNEGGRCRRGEGGGAGRDKELRL